MGEILRGAKPPGGGERVPAERKSAGKIRKNPVKKAAEGRTVDKSLKVQWVEGGGERDTIVN